MEPEFGTRPRRTISWRRVGGTVLLALFLSLLPALPEEYALAGLPGQWALIERNSGNTCVSGLAWSLKGGSGSGGDFGSRTLVRWSGNSDELPPYLRVYRDQASWEPRFLCYQPLSVGPHTDPASVCPGFCLVEAASIRPILTNPLSLFWRDPLSALLGWGPALPKVPSKYGNYSGEAGLLDRP